MSWGDENQETLPGGDHVAVQSTVSARVKGALSGQMIKRYELIHEVGRGGMSVVYKGRDTSLDRDVAVKVLHPHLASRPESSRRFQREAKAVAKLRHPSIVEIYDFSGDEETDSKFIVTEFIEGRTLREFVDEEGVAFPEVGAAITLQLCRALEHAHELGIIHRDIKPENVMVSRDGEIKLMDFGIAHVLDADRMTASGSLLGSPAHMPPEIIDGQPSDFRGDIFSLGTVLYYLCTNELPFSGNSPTQVLRNIIESRYMPPSQANPRVGRSLSRIICRCLESDPDDRFDSIEDLRDALVEELERAGIPEPGFVAREYIQDATGFAESFEPELVDNLLAQAETAVAERDVAEASDLINRVMAYRPDDERASGLLLKLRSGRRVRLALMIAAACVLLIAIGWLAVELAPQAGEQETASAAGAEGENSAELDPDAVRSLGARAGEMPEEVLLAIRASAYETGRALSPQALRIAERAGRHFTRGATIASFGAWGPRSPVALTAPVRQRVDERRSPRVEHTGGGETDAEANGNLGENAGAIGKAIEALQPHPTTRAIYEVYPDEAYAIVDGKRHYAEPGKNGSEIVIELPPGRYQVTFNCPTRCEPETRTLELPVSYGKKAETFRQRGRVVVPWADGRFRVEDKPGVYYLYQVVDGSMEDGRAGRIEPAPPNGRWITLTGWTIVGRPKTVVVFEVPEKNELDSYTRAGLRQANARSQQMEVGPGEAKSFQF